MEISDEIKEIIRDQPGEKADFTEKSYLNIFVIFPKSACNFMRGMLKYS